MAKKKKATFAQAAKKRAKSAMIRENVPFRDLWKDGVTYSFLSEFLNCREQARLSYVEGWSQKGLIEAFEFGNCIHNCLEAYGKNRRRRFDHNALLNKYRIDRSRNLTAAEQDELKRIVETAKLVWPAYLNWWENKKGMETLPDCEFVSLEEDFKFAHQLPDGSEIILRGRIDGLLRYKGKLWLMENKTKSVVDERIADYLPHDMQTMMYCHCMQVIYGEPVEGVLYNVVRRPGLRLNKNRDVPDLLERIRTDLETRPDYYFLRWNVYLNRDDVTKWVDRVLNPILTNVKLWWQEIEQNPFDPFSIPNRVHHYISPTGLYTQYGRSNYFDLLTTGNDYGFYKRPRS